MNELRRVMPWAKAKPAQVEPLITREWLVTNGLGGYASGSVSGVITRRYHGYLIAALPAPFGRTVMLNHISEQLKLFGDQEFEGQELYIGVEDQSPENLSVHTAKYLDEFRLEMGLPVRSCCDMFREEPADAGLD